MMKKRYLRRAGTLALSTAMIFSAAMPAAAAEPEQQEVVQEAEEQENVQETEDAVQVETQDTVEAEQEESTEEESSEDESTEDTTESEGEDEAESDTIWTLGLKNNVNGPEDGKQGTNGWYFLYTDDIDVAKDTVYNVSNFKECTWASKGSLQLASEGGSYEAMWMPENYLKDGLTGDALVQPYAENPDATFNNWVMTSDGTLNTSVETTAVTGIYAWEAPEDGEYRYELNYEAGGDHCELGGTTYYYFKDYFIKDGTSYKKTPEQREGGVAVSVNTKNEKKDYVQCVAKTPEHDYLYSGTFIGTAELTKGEKLYFAVDPREVGTYDMANLKITVTTADACEWSEPAYTWDDNYVCTATKTCATHKGHESAVSVEGALVEGAEGNKEATCMEAGYGTFYADFKSDEFVNQTKSGEIKKLDHDFSKAWDDYFNVPDRANSKIIWADDYSSCTWETKCANCDTFGEVEATDNIGVKGITATCTEAGTIAYTASFYWGWLWVESEEVEVDEPLGHDFSSDIYSARYELTDDKTLCTKYYICSRCEEEEQEGDTVQTTIKEPTCTEAGKVSASFDWGWDVYEEKLPALDHEWGEWKSVSAATTSKKEVQERVCAVCQEKETREVGSVLPTKVNKIAVSGISKKVAAKKSIQLTAAVSPSNATDKGVTWTTSNKKYATVNAKGKVTTKAAGAGKTVTITATAKDGSGVKATYKIKIMKNSVKSISLKAKAKTVKAGKKTTVKATVKTTGKSSVNKTLKWTSSNTKYASVNSKGVVTTKKAGKGKTVKITAAATDGSGRSKTIKIKIK